jgi:hypothetical protein
MFDLTFMMQKIILFIDGIAIMIVAQTLNTGME